MNAIIFDFDGTIADSFDQVLLFLLHEAGRKPIDVTPDEMVRYKGLAMRDLATQIGVPKWRLPFTYFRGKSVMSHNIGKLTAFAGVPEVIQTLHSEHYQLFIVSSNSKRNITAFLTQHGLSGYFDKIYGNAGWFGKGKVLKRVIRHNHLKAAKSVYVGDEVRDMVGAHDAHMPSIAVNWGFGSEEQLLLANPTILVRSTAELQKVLVDWGSAS